MKLAMESPLTGKINVMELPLTPGQYRDALIKRGNGALIQDAFPTLTAEQREFVLTGYTPEDWAAMFGSEE